MSDLSDIPQRAAIDGAMVVPRNLLAPSSTPAQAMRRARFTPAGLFDLGTSMRAHGQLAPINVRPHPAHTPTNGVPPYEIVAGERRWLASGELRLAVDGEEDRTLPAMEYVAVIVKAMTDLEVLEVQLIENLQREGLHPLEEAEGYEALLRKENGLQGYANADEIAARIGKSRRYVYNRLKLCALCQEARTACYDDKISASVAMALATLPHHELQRQALALVLQGWGGEALSYRQTVQMLHKEFMLDLASAPFDIRAVYTVAGACTSCPKRTGAGTASLFDDQVAVSDQCQDRECFAAKKAEHLQLAIDKARADGKQVLDEEQGRKVMPYADYVYGDWRNLDRPAITMTPDKRPLREIITFTAADVHVVERDGKLHELVSRELVEAELRKLGLLHGQVQDSGDDDDSAVGGSARKASPEAKLKPLTDQQSVQFLSTVRDAAIGRLAFQQLHACLSQGELPVIGLKMAAQIAYDNASYEAIKLVLLTHDPECKDAAGHPKLEGLMDRINNSDPDNPDDARMLGQLLIELVIAEPLTDRDPLEQGLAGRHDGLVLAEHYGIDLDAVREQAEVEADIALKAEQRKRGAPEPKPADATEVFMATHANQAASPSTRKPGVRYRNPATGETWSGRGLQPKWLKAALEDGKTLADFDTTRTTDGQEG